MKKTPTKKKQSHKKRFNPNDHQNPGSFESIYNAFPSTILSKKEQSHHLTHKKMSMKDPSSKKEVSGSSQLLYQPHQQVGMPSNLFIQTYSVHSGAMDLDNNPRSPIMVGNGMINQATIMKQFPSTDKLNNRTAAGTNPEERKEFGIFPAEKPVKQEYKISNIPKQGQLRTSLSNAKLDSFSIADENYSQQTKGSTTNSTSANGNHVRKLSQNSKVSSLDANRETLGTPASYHYSKKAKRNESQTKRNMQGSLMNLPYLNQQANPQSSGALNLFQQTANGKLQPPTLMFQNTVASQAIKTKKGPKVFPTKPAYSPPQDKSPFQSKQKGKDDKSSKYASRLRHFVNQDKEDGVVITASCATSQAITGQGRNEWRKDQLQTATDYRQEQALLVNEGYDRSATASVSPRKSQSKFRSTDEFFAQSNAAQKVNVGFQTQKNSDKNNVLSNQSSTVDHLAQSDRITKNKSNAAIAAGIQNPPQKLKRQTIGVINRLPTNHYMNNKIGDQIQEQILNKHHNKESREQMNSNTNPNMVFFPQVNNSRQSEDQSALSLGNADKSVVSDKKIQKKNKKLQERYNGESNNSKDIGIESQFYSEISLIEVEKSGTIKKKKRSHQTQQSSKGNKKETRFPQLGNNNNMPGGSFKQPSFNNDKLFQSPLKKDSDQKPPLGKSQLGHDSNNTSPIRASTKPRFAGIEEVKTSSLFKSIEGQLPHARSSIDAHRTKDSDAGVQNLKVGSPQKIPKRLDLETKLERTPEPLFDSKPRHTSPQKNQKSYNTNDAKFNKDRNQQIENLLKNKQQTRPANPMQYHRDVIRTYLHKNGIDQDRLVFVFNSNDTHIKRAMLNRGWFENKLTDSNIFDLKWDVNDNDFNNLRKGQFYNHFPNNRELTTKSGLNKSLLSITQHGCKVDSFFPRSFDFSDIKQIDEFIRDFEQTSIFNIIKKHASYFKKIHKEEINCIKLELDQVQKGFNYYEIKAAIKAKYAQAYQFEDATQEISGTKFTLNSPNESMIHGFKKDVLTYECNVHLLQKAIRYCKQLLHLIDNDCVQEEIIKKPKQKKYQNAPLLTTLTQNKKSAKFMKLLLKYAEVDDPFWKLPIGSEKLQSAKGWGLPSLLLEYKVIKLHQRLKQVFPYYKADGTQNIWISKPCYNARGLGIFCLNNLKDALNGGKKVQSRILQKYVERPLLLNMPTNGIQNSPKPKQGQSIPKQIYQPFKFDIRQWVLVTSFEPLVIYMFSTAYLRLCGSSYDLSDISDGLRHISNFSKQKANKNVNDVNEDLVMSIPQFESHLQQHHNQSLDWKSQIFPQIKTQVTDTLLSVQESIDQKTNSFEVYGFDFILDEKLKPWLLEVNLSPACAERTEFLTSMLNNMGEGILEIIEGKIIQRFNGWSEGGDLQKRYEQQIKSQSPEEMTYVKDYEEGKEIVNNCWYKILDQRKTAAPKVNEAQNYQNKLNYGQLEITGEKINVRSEKKLDTLYRKYVSTLFIQRMYRGYRGRIRAYQRKRYLAAIIIQKNLRVSLAKNIRHYLLQVRCATFIQKNVRKFQAQNHLEYLKIQKRNRQKHMVAMSCQKWWRMIKATRNVQELRKQTRARSIQCAWRQNRSRKTFQNKVLERGRIKRLQKFWKGRFRKRLFALIVIQKWARMINQKKKYLKLKKISIAGFKLKEFIHKKLQQKCLKTLRHNNTAITLQSIYRSKLCQKQLKSLKQSQAQSQVKEFTHRYFVKLVIDHIKKSRKAQIRSSILIQKTLKKRLAKDYIKKLKVQREQSASAIVIQKFLRGLIAQKKVLKMRQRIEAAIAIQAYFRMVLCRRKFLKLMKKRKRKQYKLRADQDKKSKRQNKLEQEVENYIENLFYQEVKKRGKKDSSSRLTSAKSKQRMTAIPKVAQNVIDDLLYNEDLPPTENSQIYDQLDKSNNSIKQSSYAASGKGRQFHQHYNIDPQRVEKIYGYKVASQYQNQMKQGQKGLKNFHKHKAGQMPQVNEKHSPSSQHQNIIMQAAKASKGQGKRHQSSITGNGGYNMALPLSSGIVAISRKSVDKSDISELQAQVQLEKINSRPGVSHQPNDSLPSIHQSNVKKIKRDEEEKLIDDVLYSYTPIPREGSQHCISEIQARTESKIEEPDEDLNTSHHLQNFKHALKNCYIASNKDLDRMESQGDINPLFRKSIDTTSECQNELFIVAPNDQTSVVLSNEDYAAYKEQARQMGINAGYKQTPNGGKKKKKRLTELGGPAEPPMLQGARVYQMYKFTGAPNVQQNHKQHFQSQKKRPVSGQRKFKGDMKFN